jgi:hypothetical protein
MMSPVAAPRKRRPHRVMGRSAGGRCDRYQSGCRLATEQFVLQAARSANVGEMTGRATVYINSIVGGVGLALLVAKVASLETGAALAVGIIAAVALFGLHLLYQQQRATDRVLRPPAEASSA